MYGCSPRWNSPWISETDLWTLLSQLARHIAPAPYGPDSLGLSHGLHFTGGEPFLNLELLCKAFEMATELDIPSTFAETNCFWAKSDDEAREILLTLKAKGMKGLMISVNPFYLEYVPFERTERAVRAGLEIFGSNLMVYQIDYFRRFKRWGLRGKVSFDEYLRLEQSEALLRNVEFFAMGRAPFELKETLRKFIPCRPAKSFLSKPCDPPFLRSWHNHIDNQGNYIPGFCGGISLGDCRELDQLLANGVDLAERPVLGFIANDDFKGLFAFAQQRGFNPSAEGYLSKCHLCLDLRRHLINHAEYKELVPREMVAYLETRKCR